MDVVIIKDMGPVLSACATASKLEQRRSLMADKMRMYNSGGNWCGNWCGNSGGNSGVKSLAWLTRCAYTTQVGTGVGIGVGTLR